MSSNQLFAGNITVFHTFWAVFTGRDSQLIHGESCWQKNKVLKTMKSRLIIAKYHIFLFLSAKYPGKNAAFIRAMTKSPNLEKPQLTGIYYLNI